ncbi:MAG: Arm DNA-binding domain-containing protein, partial [Zoogloeaceae bacterium]|nr:Arm DNA-binding domain-containing protein [Zoogloeaceae bacterium]
MPKIKRVFMGTRTAEGVVMALSDTKLRNLKPADKSYQEADEGGLFVEVMPGSAKVWRMRYRIGGRGSKQEKITLGDYPTYSLAEARTWRDDCKILAGRGLSPMALRRGDAIPEDTAPAVKELAQAFIREWCLKTREKAKIKEEAAREADTVKAFAMRWYKE